MIVIVCILSLTAVGFGLLSFSFAGLWSYYLPAALAGTLICMHAVDGRNRHVARRITRSFPNLLSADEREMFLRSPSLFVPQLEWQHFLFAGGDIVSIIHTAAGIALVYGIVSACRQAWTPALLGLGIVLYSLLGPLANAFPAGNPVDSEARAVSRCLAHRHRGGNAEKRVASDLSQDIDTCYWRTLNKLHSLPAALDRNHSVTWCAGREQGTSPAQQPEQKSEVSIS